MLREHTSAAGDSKFQTLGKCHFLCLEAQTLLCPRPQGPLSESAVWTPKQGEGKAKSPGFWGTSVGTGVWYNFSTQLCTELGSRKGQAALPRPSWAASPLALSCRLSSLWLLPDTKFWET